MDATTGGVGFHFGKQAVRTCWRISSLVDRETVCFVLVCRASGKDGVLAHPPDPILPFHFNGFDVFQRFLHYVHCSSRRSG